VLRRQVLDLFLLLRHGIILRCRRYLRRASFANAM
jgi:hypothetical protein